MDCENEFEFIYLYIGSWIFNFKFSPFFKILDLQIIKIIELTYPSTSFAYFHN